MEKNVYVSKDKNKIEAHKKLVSDYILHSDGFLLVGFAYKEKDGKIELVQIGCNNSNIGYAKDQKENMKKLFDTIYNQVDKMPSFEEFIKSPEKYLDKIKEFVDKDGTKQER